MKYFVLRFSFIIVLLLSLYCLSYSQYEHVWAFGDSAGIDFNTSPPTSIATRIATNEGCASICDALGRLLFYTDGTTVWDVRHNIMPNGENLPGFSTNITNSTSQGTLIVPIPGNSFRYYVFSLSSWESGFAGRLYYCIVDMTLNGGRGDVIVESKGRILADRLTEQMTTVSGNNCNIWLMAAGRTDLKIHAYSINFDGIDTVPVTSPRIRPEGILGDVIGCMDVSPDRTKIALAHGNLVLYNFDATTGIVTNPVVLEQQGLSFKMFGVAFSPASSKLYATATAREKEGIYQFDVSISDTQQIIASKTKIGDNRFYAIKRAPDGKVYIAVAGASLGVINKPDLAGAACDFVANGFPLLNGTRSLLGLPNSITRLTGEQFYSVHTDTAHCADSLLLRPNAPDRSNYTWENGSKDQERYVYESGTYWVTYQHSLPGQCLQYADTFKIILNKIKRTYTTTTFEGRCKTDTFLMQASNPDGSNYTWEDGSKGNSRKINKSGIYWVSYQIDTSCEHFADTFNVTYPDEDYKVSFTVDTLICQTDTVFVNNTSDAPFNRFDWTFGDGNSSTNRAPNHHYEQEGAYQVRLIGMIDDVCPDTATVTLVVDPVIPVGFVTNLDSICRGGSINFDHQMNSSTLVQLLWNWGDGTQQWALEQNGIQHAYEIAGIMEVTLHAQFRGCPESTFSDTVYVFELPKVDLGSDTGMCVNGSPIILTNRHAAAERIDHHLWSTGDTTENLKVVHPGTYSLTLIHEPLGCRATESITINKDCWMNIPNAFSPDGDGINDYFFPRQLLTKNLTNFKMQVLDRWGQILFETTSVEGRGWDGRFNGQTQPAAVYVYSIEARFKDYIESYRGNVTLIR